MNYFITFLLFIVSFFNNFIFSITPKNGDIPGQFSFSLLPTICVDYITRKEYVAAGEAPISDRAKYFGISVCEKNGTYFYPMLSENAYLNSILIKNPLFGASCENLRLMFMSGITGMTDQKNLPAVNIKDDARVIILAKSNPYINENLIIMATEYLTDYKENEAKIIDFVTNTNGFTVITCAKNKNFADVDSNSALYQFSLNENILKRGTLYGVNLAIKEMAKKQYDSTISAFKIDDTDVISLDSGKLILFGDTALNTTYIGVSGSGTSGIRAATVNNDELLPITACDDDPYDNIISTKSSDKKIIINGLDVSHTSTGLAYLVVLGGASNSIISENITTINNNNDDVKNSVYALPLINVPTSNYCKIESSYCKLAKIGQKPQLCFMPRMPFRYVGTFFTIPAEKPGDLYKSDNIKAKVGRGKLEVNSGLEKFSFTIKSIESFSDSIFALASFDGNSDQGVGGLFYSQAIFDEYGAIDSWTPWQRKNLVGNFSTQTYIPQLGAHVAMLDNSKKKVFQTDWTSYGPWSQGINNIYSNLPLSESGVQKIVDISHFHPGVGSDSLSIGFKPSFTFYVGYNTVILQQTSNNSCLLPTKYSKSKIFTDGTLSGFNYLDSYSVIVFTGGELNNAGAIATAAIGYIENTDCWLIVGGTNGLFILTKPSGNGCGTGLLKNKFEGLNSEMSWIELGYFKNIKKIVSQNNYLYIVSNDSIDKIELSSNNISKGKNCNVINMAKASDFSSGSYPSFSDGLFSGNAAIIASNDGLYNYISNKWKKIILPGGEYAPLYLFSFSSTGNPDDWAKGNQKDISGNKIIAGNIYIATTSIPTHQSELYRMVSYGADDGVKDDTIVILPNYFLNGQPTYYCNPGSELLSIIGDGAAWYTHSIFSTGLVYRGYIGLINPFLATGITNQKIEINLVMSTKSLNQYIGPVCYSSGFGLWVSGDKSGLYGLW